MSDERTTHCVYNGLPNDIVKISDGKRGAAMRGSQWLDLIDMAFTDETPADAGKIIADLQARLESVREFRKHLRYAMSGELRDVSRYSVDSHYVNQLDAALSPPALREAQGG